MRIALLASEPLDVASRSGTAVAVASLRDALARRGAALETVAPRRVSRLGIAATSLVFNARLRAASFEGVDAVLGLGGDGRRLAGTLQVPFVALIKALYPEVLPFERGATRAMLRVLGRWETAAARAASAVVVPSGYAAEAVRRHFGVPSTRLHIVPEPFDLDAWRLALPVTRRQGRRVLCVAQLYPRKRVADLVAAWPSVTAQIPDAELEIVGAGPGLAAVRVAAARLASCAVRGHVPRGPELAAAYARADVFCLPSAQETFGIAAVEAMASGLPLVVAGAGALPETVAGAVAETVRVGDTAALAAALVRALGGDNRERAAAVNPDLTRRFEPGAVADRMLAAIFANRG